MVGSPLSTWVPKQRKAKRGKLLTRIPLLHLRGFGFGSPTLAASAASTSEIILTSSLWATLPSSPR